MNAGLERRLARVFGHLAREAEPSPLTDEATDPAPAAAEPAREPELRFVDFVRQAWHVVEPATPLVEGWYLDAICLHLEAVSRGAIRRLVINIPPRMLKSTLVSVLWPAWEWTFAPFRRVLSASYAEGLAVRDAARTRRLLLSPWYQARWGDRFALLPDMNAKRRFDNTAGGHRIAIGVDGAGTGEGGDILIADDPNNVRDAESPAMRQNAIDWWTQVFSQRLNDRRRGAVVVIQQRTNELDLTGYLLSQPDHGWTHLMLPQEFEPERRCATSIGWEDPRTEPGELLCPDRIGSDDVARLQLDLGPRGYSGQHQQRPAPAGGEIFKASDWRWFRPSERPAYREVVVMADTASKTGETNDYTAFTAWGEFEGGIDYLVGWRERWAFPELVERAKAFWALVIAMGYRPTRFIIEDKASGVALIQVLRQVTKLPVIAYLPEIVGPDGRKQRIQGDKVVRAEAISGYHGAGRFGLPLNPDGSKPPELEGGRDSWVAEHAAFPSGAHDDRVDTTTMAGLYWLVAPPPRNLALIAADVTTKGKPGWYRSNGIGRRRTAR